MDIALEKVLASRALAGSRSLVAFLRFVVTRTLAGEQDGIKEYSIAVEALGRPVDFDPKADGVVRVQAGLLRKKLAAYYADEGRGDPLVIEIPKGGYVPTFRAAAPPAVGPSRRRAVGFAVGGAIVGGLLVALALARGESPPSTPAVWQGFLDDDLPTILAIGAPQFFAGRGVFVRDIEVNSTADAGAARMKALGEALGTELEPTELYTGIGETYGAVYVAQLFARHGRELRVLRGRNLAWQDIKDAHVVLVTSMRYRTFAQELGYPSHFVFESENRGRIVNNKPLAGEAAAYYTKDDVDYATITLWPGKTPGRRILVMSGRTTWATQGAAEYLTRPGYLAELGAKLQSCRQQTGGAAHPGAYQVLLRVEIRDAHPLAVSYVTHHDL